MRKVVVAFDYLYMDMHVYTELDIPVGAYSKKEEDLVFFVLPDDASIDDYHAMDRHFTEEYCGGLEYQQSGEYYLNQVKFYKGREKELNEKERRLHDEFNDLIDKLTDRKLFRYYR